MSTHSDKYHATGKQVLLNGAHYADAVDYDAAQAIAYAMNCVYLAKLGEPSKKRRTPTLHECTDPHCPDFGKPE